MVYILMCLSVLVLRKAPPSHAWSRPEYNAPLRPLLQIFGIISGSLLLYFMGAEAVIGAVTAGAVGWLIYMGYGRSHQSHKVSPWETFRLMSTDPYRAESRRRTAAFYAADTWGNKLLTLRQFISTVDALGIDYEDADTLREYFHAADENGDGLIHLDQFLMALETMAAED